MENETKPSYEELMHAHMQLLEDFRNLQFQYQMLENNQMLKKTKILIDMKKNQTCFTDKVNELVDFNLEHILELPKIQKCDVE